MLTPAAVRARRSPSGRRQPTHFARKTRVWGPVFLPEKDNIGRKSGRKQHRDIVEMLVLRSTCGAEGRDRTADTGFFRPVLYQLSYLGSAGERVYQARSAVLFPAGRCRASGALGLREYSELGGR